MNNNRRENLKSHTDTSSPGSYSIPGSPIRKQVHLTSNSDVQLLVGDQLHAQFFYIIRLFQSSTCFEETRAHHQEVNCINTASGIVILCKWPSSMQVEQKLLDLHTGRPLTESDYTRCCINTIDLMMMSTCLLEKCRGLK